MINPYDPDGEKETKHRLYRNVGSLISLNGDLIEDTGSRIKSTKCLVILLWTFSYAETSRFTHYLFPLSYITGGPTPRGSYGRLNPDYYNCVLEVMLDDQKIMIAVRHSDISFVDDEMCDSSPIVL